MAAMVLAVGAIPEGLPAAVTIRLVIRATVYDDAALAGIGP